MSMAPLPIFLAATAFGVREVWLLIFLLLLLVPIGICKFMMETTGRCYGMLVVCTCWLLLLLVVLTHIDNGEPAVVSLGVFFPLLVMANVLVFYSSAIFQIHPPRLAVVLGSFAVNDVITLLAIWVSPHAIRCK